MNKISDKLNVQLMAETLKAFQLDHIVLSPGSRNGALTMQFVNDPYFTTYSVVDERSAAFVALGIAQQRQQPVVICCTSGSAIANYYPAITEAFFQNVPVVVISADRPTHLVDNFDGQTIRQEDFLKQHCVHSVQLSEEDDTETLTKNMLLIKYALIDCLHKKGPIHINMPFSEPLYGSVDELEIAIDTITIHEKEYKEIDYLHLTKQWNTAAKKLVLVGMHHSDEAFEQRMINLAEDDSVVVLHEVTSNLHHQRFINKIDQSIFPLNEEQLRELKPDILLTIGQNVVSKKIKAFLRNHQPSQHWHLDEYWFPDTFQCLTEKIDANPTDFLSQLTAWTNPKTSTYYEQWNVIRQLNERKHNAYLAQVQFSDLKVFEQLINAYPSDWMVHYGNSTVIRYALLFDHQTGNPVYCNRGTSGIDGSTSTAVGACLGNKQNTVVITGDISFFYDSNALWNAHMPSNLRIIVINNGGGNIFKFIPGPSETGVVDEYFETQHALTAEHLAKMYRFDYLNVSNETELSQALGHFYDPSEQPKILEINTRNIPNAELLKGYFNSLR